MSEEAEAFAPGRGGVDEDGVLRPGDDLEDCALLRRPEARIILRACVDFL